ncbi:MAG: CBS domain-containing protein [Alphaproteobacteria bacterium]|nr:CBS domain-containing protein [Alphaproteobacteria bacterium]
MDVATILKQKSAEVLSLPPTASVAEAARVLAERHIGAVLVRSPAGQVLGILSERDLVRGLAAQGGPALALPVADLMTREVIACTPEDSVEHVMATMTQHRFRHLPVKRGDRLVGIISIGDVVKYRLDEIEFEARSLRAYIANA